MTDLTVVIPTQGRATLPRCLASMAADQQPGPRPEILVVYDAHTQNEDRREFVKANCPPAGATFLEHDEGTHNWGYPQLQYGYQRATGRYVLNIGDDDVYVPGAFETIRRVIDGLDGDWPLLFRAELHPSPNRGNRRPVLLWDERGRFERQHVTGQNFACPNDPSVMGFWWDDFCQAEATVSALGGPEVLVWREEVIARCY